MHEGEGNSGVQRQPFSIGFDNALLLERIGAAFIDLLIISFPFLIFVSFTPVVMYWIPVFALLASPYHFLFEWLMEGQSPGKKLLRIRVVRLDGHLAATSETAIRWVTRLVDVTLSLGLLSVAFIWLGKNGQRFGDRLAGTKVISLTLSSKKNKNNQQSVVPDEALNRQPVFEYALEEGKVLSLYDNHLRCGNMALLYRLMTGISFHVVTGKPSRIPLVSDTLYSVRFTTVTEDCLVEFHPFDSVAPGHTHREIEERLAQLYQRVHQLVKPYVVFNLLLAYEKTQSMKVCNLELSETGITTRNIWGLSTTVVWNEYDKAELKDGSVSLLRKNTPDDSSEFFFCSTNQMNAFVLPDLLHYLQPVNGKIETEAKEKMVGRIAEL